MSSRRGVFDQCPKILRGDVSKVLVFVFFNPAALFSFVSDDTVCSLADSLVQFAQVLRYLFLKFLLPH